MSKSTAEDAQAAAPGELRVGEWVVDSDHNEVRRGAERVRLEPKVIEVLVHLARHAGHVVGREELLAAVWPGVIVGDDALTQAIIKLRKALGDDAHKPTYIETISKRGYRLIAPVSQASPPGAQAIAEPRISGRNRALAIVAAGLVAIAIGAVLVFPEIPRTVGMPWPIVVDKAGIPMGGHATIAVLPLSNLSADAKREYFSDGLTEDIISALGRFSALRVLSRNAVEPFKTRPATPQAVRQELGVRYVVKGSVREADGKLRVAVELSDAERGTVLWADRYEGDGRAVFEIQDRIVKNIVGALAVKVTRIERERTSAKPVESLEAYDLELRARELTYRMTRETNRQARVLLARAVELAPNYAEAWVTLAHAEYRRADQGWMEDREEGMRRVEAHARRALSLDDTGAHARAHAQLARVYSRNGDLDQALAEATRAVELNPSDAVAQYAQGSVLIWLGRLEEGIAALETARHFDPNLDDVMLAIGYYTSGRYREALAETDRRIARNPDTVILHGTRVATLSQLGQVDEARLAAAQLRRIAPFMQVDLFVPGFRNPEHRAKFHEGLRKAGL